MGRGREPLLGRGRPQWLTSCVLSLGQAFGELALAVPLAARRLLCRSRTALAVPLPRRLLSLGACCAISHGVCCAAPARRLPGRSLGACCAAAAWRLPCRSRSVLAELLPLGARCVAPTRCLPCRSIGACCAAAARRLPCCSRSVLTKLLPLEALRLCVELGRGPCLCVASL